MMIVTQQDGSVVPLSKCEFINGTIRMKRAGDRLRGHRTIAEVKNPWLRKPLVVFTVAAIAVIMIPLRLLESAVSLVRDEFGEHIGDAWRGDE